MGRFFKISGIVAWVLILGVILLYITRKTDDINIPFTNDPQVLGKWEAVDFVSEPEDFCPGKRASKVSLYLQSLEFEPGGKMSVPWFRWTKNYVMHQNDRTASKYTIKTIDDQQYMFFEWKSGDSVYFRKKPKYYVLKKVPE